MPGAPTRSTPLGSRAPNFVYLSDSFKYETISINSSFASSA